MKMHTLLPTLLGALLVATSGPTGAIAQDHGGHAGHGAPQAAPQAAPDAPSPYAGQEERRIKALSGEDVEQLLRGAGMGFAKAAELNHYPGPRHVLDLGPQLDLTTPQRDATLSVFTDMQARARELGAAIVTHEHRLDAHFAAGTIDPGALAALTGEIARLRGELRAVHLQAHLAMHRILTPAQRAAYDHLRGYSQS